MTAMTAVTTESAAGTAAGTATRGRPPVPIALALVVAAAAAATGAAVAGGGPRALVVVPVLAAVVPLVVLAAVSFEGFLLALLLVRASLDAVAPGQLPLNTLVGGAFLVAAGAWLVRVWLAGDWRPLSGYARASLAFLVLVGVTVPFSLDPPASTMELARIAGPIVMLVALEQMVRTRSQARRLVVVVLLSAVPVVIVALQQAAFGGDLLVRDGFARVNGTFLHSNPMAMYATFVLVAAAALVPVLDGGRRLAMLVGAGALGVALYFTYTRTAWLAVVVGLLLVVVLRRAANVVPFLVAVVLVVALNPSIVERFGDVGESVDSSGNAANSVAWRTEYWAESIDLVGPRTATGIGLDGVAAATDEGKPPHNDLVRSFAEAGVIGAVGYLVMLGGMVSTAVRAARRRRETTGLAAAVSIGFAAMSASYLLFALTSNMVSQVAVLWYFAAFGGLARWAVEPSAAPPLGALDRPAAR